MNEKDLFGVAQEALDGYKNFIDFLKKEKTCRETQRLAPAKGQGRDRR